MRTITLGRGKGVEYKSFFFFFKEKLQKVAGWILFTFLTLALGAGFKKKYKNIIRPSNNWREKI